MSRLYTNTELLVYRTLGLAFVLRDQAKLYLLDGKAPPPALANWICDQLDIVEVHKPMTPKKVERFERDARLALELRVEQIARTAQPKQRGQLSSAAVVGERRHLSEETVNRAYRDHRKLVELIEEVLGLDEMPDDDVVFASLDIVGAEHGERLKDAVSQAARSLDDQIRDRQNDG